jgi:hypothetical protein
MNQQNHDTEQNQRLIEAAINLHHGFPFGEIRHDGLPTLRLRALVVTITVLVGILIFSFIIH